MSDHLTPEVIETGLRLDAARTPGEWAIADRTEDESTSASVLIESRAPGLPNHLRAVVFTAWHDGLHLCCLPENLGFIAHAANYYAAALREVGGLREEVVFFQGLLKNHRDNTIASRKRAEAAEAEIARLRAAVAEHHAQKADDRCWLDDRRLYEAFGLPPADNSVGDTDAMLANCRRFIRLRCQGGGPWKSYAELEAEGSALRTAALDLIRELDREPPEPARVALTLDALRELAVEKGDGP